jgi:predicted RecA/RadA family phage recombinase
MAIATFVHDGGAIDYTPSADVAAGEVVVLADLVGVTKIDIAANKLGALHVTGVYDVPKASGAGTGIGNGVSVYWDATAKQATATPGSRPLLGQTVAAAADAATTVRVRLAGPRALEAILADRPIEAVTLAGGSKTLDAEDVGKVLNVTVGHATNVITLPATAAGLEYLVRCGAAGQRVALSPNAADKIMGADLAGVDNKDHILAAATALAGDFVHLKADGANGWYIVAERGTWTNEA